MPWLQSLFQVTCSHCKKRPALPNRKRCDFCTKSAREGYVRLKKYARKRSICIRCRRASSTLVCKRCESDPKARKARTQRWREIGRCYECGRRPMAGRKSCKKCLTRRKRAQGRQQEYLEERAQCSRCKLPLDNLFRGRCARCLRRQQDEYKGLQAQREASGVCKRCGERPVAPDHKSCQVCLDRRNEQQRVARGGPTIQKTARKQKYDATKAAGLCVTCHRNPVAPDRSRCQGCLERYRKISAKNYEKTYGNEKSTVATAWTIGV